jgi:ABC-2 type transport system ATP-binding protein
VLTDVLFIDRGRIVLQSTMDDFDTRFTELIVRPDALVAARSLRPIYERDILGQNILYFDGVERRQLSSLGEVRTPSIADLFVAVMSRSNAVPSTGAANDPRGDLRSNLNGVAR